MVLIILMVSAGLLNPQYAFAAPCTAGDFRNGACVASSIGNGGVDLRGTVTDRGGSRNGSETTVGRGGGSGAAEETEAPCVGAVICRDGYTATMPTDGRGPVTLADLVNFQPEVGVHRMEPSGWMVVGLDTNFYVETGAHVQDGLLLGVPASVRFTPVSYRWDYGDGSAATRSAGGASWRTLGLPEFAPTATSHVYSRPGTYGIDVTVDFRAEYTFGGATWTSIAGTLPIPSAELTAVAGDADTVLVGRDCTIDARGPGC